jgi:hypothetical protein
MSNLNQQSYGQDGGWISYEQSDLYYRYRMNKARIQKKVNLGPLGSTRNLEIALKRPTGKGFEKALRTIISSISPFFFAKYVDQANYKVEIRTEDFKRDGKKLVSCLILLWRAKKNTVVVRRLSASLRGSVTNSFKFLRGYLDKNPQLNPAL